MRKTLFVIAALLIASALADVKLVTSEFNTQNFDNSAVQGWYVQGNKNGALTSVCDGQTVFGGFDVFGVNAEASKDYDSGVDHFELTISFDLYSIDSWDTETLKLFVDDDAVYSFTSQYNNPSPQPVKCGAGWGDRLTSVRVKFPHYRRRFSVRLTSNLNQDANDESWGIKNLQILARHGGGNVSLVAEEFSSNNFKESVDGWTLVGLDASQAFTNCNGAQLFGGYNSMGKGTIVSKTFEKLPVHYSLIVSFDLWLVDSPDVPNDYVQVIVDGQIYRYTRPDSTYTDSKNFQCGVSGWSERVIRVNLFVAHRGSSVNLALRAVFDENRDNESFGIRNLRIVSIGCSSSRCKQVANEFSSPIFTDAPGWVSGANKDISTSVHTCSKVSLFGQIGAEGAQKFYDNLLPHSSVRIFFRVLTTGTWSNEANLQVYVNEILASAKVAAEFTKNKVCNDDNEQVRNFYVDIPHSSSFLNLELKPVNFGANTRFSIRDLSITSYVEEGQTLISSEFSSSNFDNTDGWTVTGNLANRRVTQCGRYSLFGGYNAFGKKTSISKTFASLPTHNYITITYTVYFVDTWDREDFTVTIDGQAVQTVTKSSTWGGHRHMCGWDAAMEEVYVYQVYVPHTASSLKLEFSDKLDQNQDDESWGIRDIVISTGVNLEAGQSSGDSSNCIQIYTACQFGGQSLSVCDDIPDLKAIGWTAPIRSVSIPQGKSIKVYKSSQYKGEFKQFDSSQECLTGTNFLLINKAFNIDVSNSSLRQRHARK